MLVVLGAEELVSGVGTHATDATLEELVDDGDDDVLLLLAVGEGIEGEDGDAWIVDEEVALEGVVENDQTFGEQVLVDAGWNLGDWNLVRGQRNAQIVCDEYLERLAPLADGLFDVGGLALEWETVDALDGGVVERHGHECGNLPVAQVGQRHVERGECRLACLLCGLSEVNLLLVLPFGVMVEKVIGAKRFLILSAAAWLADITTIYIVCSALIPEGEECVVKGASGLAFAYVPVGLYIFLILGKRSGFGNLFKQVSFYLLMPIAITTLVFACSPSIAGTTDVWSMLLHLIGITCGVVFAVIYRNAIKSYFDVVVFER